MTGSVILRNGHEIVDDQIIHNDRPMSWEEADKRAGFRLDRRKAWAFIPETSTLGVPELCEQISFTAECSGCADTEDFYSSSGKGGGCRECGYTGKRRQVYFVPVCSDAD